MRKCHKNIFKTLKTRFSLEWVFKSASIFTCFNRKPGAFDETLWIHKSFTEAVQWRCLHISLFSPSGGDSSWACGTRTPLWETSWGLSSLEPLSPPRGECPSSSLDSSSLPLGSCASSSLLKVSFHSSKRCLSHFHVVLSVPLNAPCFTVSCPEPEDVNCSPPQHHVSFSWTPLIWIDSKQHCSRTHWSLCVRVRRRTRRRSLCCRTYQTATQPSTAASPQSLQWLCTITQRL